MSVRRRQDPPLRPRDEARRRFLVRALSLGVLAGGTGWSLPALASLFGKLPGRLPEGRSVFEARGDVRVNGKPAGEATPITAADRIEVGSNSYLIAAVGDTAFLVRENSSLELAGAGRLVVRSLRLVTGAVLSVFGRREAAQSVRIGTPVATIGVRGTGVYTESDPQKTYLCTCYGVTDLAPVADPKETEQIRAQHHDAPRYILSRPEQGRRIVPAPFINHTDLELMTLEALVGRQVPFGLPAQEYEAPRRDY